jgi:topoisomerase IA-like protein
MNGALEVIGDAHMAKYGRKAGAKVKRAMHKRKRGTLKSGGSGKTVKSRKQAIAIGLAEARREGGKVPAKKSSSKKSSSKKSSSKKSSSKKSPSRKSSRKSSRNGAKKGASRK